MKHALVLLSLFLLLQSQNLRFSIGGQLNSLLETDEEIVIEPYKNKVKKESLADAMSDATGLSMEAKFFASKTIAFGLRYSYSSHNFKAKWNNIPPGSTFAISSFMPNLNIGKISDNGTYFYGVLGLNIESYSPNIRQPLGTPKIEAQEIFKTASHFIFGMGLDLPPVESHSFGFAFDISYQLGSVTTGKFFNGPKDFSADAFRMGVKLFFILASSDY
jgi:hypothetical protein